MKIKILSEEALRTIHEYRDVPYFNNKTLGTRGALKAEVGKGSPEDIKEEVKNIAIRKKIKIENMPKEELKKFMVNNNIGIDCSGFAYHVLNSESKGMLGKSIDFGRVGFIRKIRAKMMPAKNVDVRILVHNSQPKTLRDIEPGDLITILSDRDHVLVIYKIEYENNLPRNIYYVHSMAWPADGQYGHGIHYGKIEIVDLQKGIVDQRWDEEYTYERARG